MFNSGEDPGLQAMKIRRPEQTDHCRRVPKKVAYALVLRQNTFSGAFRPHIRCSSGENFEYSPSSHPNRNENRLVQIHANRRTPN